MRTRKDSRGFTLLELMIAISVICIMAVIIGSSLRLSLRSVDLGEKKIESDERLRVSLDIINAHIQSGFAASPAAASGGNMKPFVGEHLALRFPTSYSLWGAAGGNLEVAYRVEEDERGGKALYAAESPTGGNDPREVKLLDGMQEISFDYFYRGPSDEKGAWVEQWTYDDNRPEKIRVNLLRDGKDLTLILHIRNRPKAAKGPA